MTDQQKDPMQSRFHACSESGEKPFAFRALAKCPKLKFLLALSVTLALACSQAWIIYSLILIEEHLQSLANQNEDFGHHHQEAAKNIAALDLQAKSLHHQQSSIKEQLNALEKATQQMGEALHEQRHQALAGPSSLLPSPSHEGQSPSLQSSAASLNTTTTLGLVNLIASLSSGDPVQVKDYEAILPQKLWAPLEQCAASSKGQTIVHKFHALLPDLMKTKPEDSLARIILSRIITIRKTGKESASDTFDHAVLLIEKSIDEQRFDDAVVLIEKLPQGSQNVLRPLLALIQEKKSCAALINTLKQMIVPQTLSHS